MATSEYISHRSGGNETAAVFVASYLRKRRQAEESLVKAADREKWKAQRYGTTPSIDLENMPTRRTPLFTELIGDSHEQKRYCSLFISAILMGNARRQEAITLATPLDDKDVMKYDAMAAAIEAGQLDYENLITQSDVRYAHELVQNLELQSHASEPIAIAARIAIETAFSQQPNSVA